MEKGFPAVKKKKKSFLKKITLLPKQVVQTILNDIPTKMVNAGYNLYSNFQKGQLSMGLPISSQMLETQEQIRNRAAAKLALTLYHIFLKTTRKRIPRKAIKHILMEEVHRRRLVLTEDVIILNREELIRLVRNQFKIEEIHLDAILEEASRRVILREALQVKKAPAYFESRIDEKEFNGRGDYEIVYYKDYTSDGKEIGFQRLVSIESVTMADNRPSVLLVPGFANNSRCYNLSNRYSIAKDFADMGYWTYLFDPRGVGINEGKFDPYYTIDTLIDHDLPTVVKFIHARSKGKPSILMGHSMGGIISENMVLNWGLRKNLKDNQTLSQAGRTILDRILPDEQEADQNLSMVKGIITLGSPKFFKKNTHLVFPSGLWLNHLARMLRLRYVPIQEVFWLMTQPPVLKQINRFILNHNIGNLNFLVNPENHLDDKEFAQQYLAKAMESVPLGMGFQILKAIYNGEGFKRMDETRLNYSRHADAFPADIPLFHFWSTTDPVSSPKNIKYSRYYPHRYKRVYRIETVDDLNKVEILPEKSQLIDFIISDTKHVDFLYGRTAEEVIQPLLFKIIDQVWGDWTYENSAAGSL
ncbi:MAG: alpha/beta fold hydrolase [Desulfobacteraceae bacterium]|nr:MAG: alpha/beta fold hydrolase [Desulfobacteraceae bacterium]